MAKDKPFNNPFQKLTLARGPDRSAEADAKKEERRDPPPGSQPPSREPSTFNRATDEEALFLSFVGEVEPLRKGPPLVHPPAPSREALRLVQSGEEDALVELCELVAGRPPSS